MNEIDKLIEEQFKKLPLNLQRAINAVPWKSLVEEVGRANALNAEQIALLEQETMFIIYAFENPDDYVSNIARELNMSEEIAYTIAESIGNKIFVPISDESERQNIATPTDIPAIPPIILPMVEKGEVAHTVPHIEQPNPSTPLGASNQTKVSLPDYRYESGKDPYRESPK